MEKTKSLTAKIRTVLSKQGLKIGKYTIYRFDDNSVWIGHENGEGAQFSNHIFLPVIDKFYKENF